MRDKIKERLPHRYPFLFLDRIVDLCPGKWVKGYKNISYNECFFSRESHSLEFPGMLVVEAIAQLSAFTTENESGKIGMLTSLKDIQFNSLPIAGDRLDLYFEIVRQKDRYIRGKGMAMVNDKKIVIAKEIGIYLVDR